MRVYHLECSEAVNYPIDAKAIREEHEKLRAIKAQIKADRGRRVSEGRKNWRAERQAIRDSFIKIIQPRGNYSLSRAVYPLNAQPRP